MSCSTHPEYFTLSSIDCYDGRPTVLGIFENMEAVTARLSLIHSSCGDEYHIECFHLSKQSEEEKRLKDVLKQRREVKKKREELQAA
tara:strand:+ start:1515 stop:1775 length:261 start_codon:yes stop_codon:yes gene_type:complete